MADETRPTGAPVALTVTACVWAVVLCIGVFVLHPDAYTRLTSPPVTATFVPDVSGATSSGLASNTPSISGLSPAAPRQPAQTPPSRRSSGFDPLLETVALTQLALCAAVAAILVKSRWRPSLRLWRLGFTASIAILAQDLVAAAIVLTPIVATPVGVLLLIAYQQAKPLSENVVENHP